MSNMKTDISNIKSDVSTLKSDVSNMKSGMNEMRNELSGLRTDLSELKTGQDRLQQNIIESFGTYTEKISEHVDHKTDALNKRVFNLETDFQRLSRQ